MSNEKAYWQTKDGSLIDIDTMDVEHLRNVLKMIVKKQKGKIKPFSTEEINRLTQKTPYQIQEEGNLWK